MPQRSFAAARAMPLTPALLGLCLLSGNLGQWPVWLAAGLVMDVGKGVRARLRAA